MSERILVFIPMYRCERQIPRVLERISAEARTWVSAVVVVDNRSPDGSVAAAETALKKLPLPAKILKNVDNFNLGGSHKVAFDYAQVNGFDYVVVLHGDDQADINDFTPFIQAGRHRTLDALLGSRFSRGSRRVGYSRFRIFGNYVFNGLFSLVAGRWLVDLGSGLNLFAVPALKDGFYRTLADDLTFNNHLLLSLVVRRARFAFVPISWREEDQVSNVRLFRQAWRTVGIVASFALRRGAYLRRSHARHAPDAYTATVVYKQDGQP